MNYAFFNAGSITSFNPDKKTTDASGNRVTLLDLHKEMVRDAGRKDVYILNHKGREVDCSFTPVAMAA